MKKFLSLSLAAMLALTMLAGCGEKKEEPAADENEAVEQEQVNDENTLTMGTNAEFPPYEYYENGEIIGIDAEIAAAIAEKLGLKLVIQDMKFDSIITSVQSGGIDIGMAGMTVTDERKESVDFTSSYATGVQSIIVKEDSDIASPDDLAGKKIGVQLATTGDIYASDDYGEENVVKYSKGADAVLALTGGEVDAVIIDDQPAKSFVENNEGLKILDTEYVTEEYAIAVSKDNKELTDKINVALEELIADGTVDNIVNKYIKAE